MKCARRTKRGGSRRWRAFAGITRVAARAQRRPARALRWWPLTLALLLLVACAGKEVTRQRFFWPIGIDDPKIEFIRTIGSDRDVRAGAESPWMEEILGIQEPQLIFGSPYDVAVDDQGRIYVSDLAKREVSILDLAAHEVRHFEHPGQDDLYYQSPMGLAAGCDGGVYVSDNPLGRIFLFGADDRKLRKIFGQGILTRPTGLACDPVRNRLYVADTGAHQVMIFSGAGEWLKTLGRRGAAQGEFNYPLDLDVDRDGNLYVLDALNARVQVFSPEGVFLRSFGERGTSLGSFQMAKGIAVDRSGQVYVTDGIAHRFVIFDGQGRHLMTLGERISTEGKAGLPGGFDMPKGIDADADDGVWVVDSFNRMVHKYQFLNEHYLKKQPILPGQAHVPEGLE